MIFKLRPAGGFCWDDAASDLAQSICDVSLHAEIFLFVDGFEKLDFEEFLGCWGQLAPNIRVGWGTEVGEAESDLGGREVSEFSWVLA